MVAYLFPGQGSQRPGMGQGLVKEPWASQVVRTCEELTGLPLAEAVSDRPETLARTQVVQPALLMMAWLGVLQLDNAGWGCQVVAGHSLGEYAALAAAGVVAWEDAVRLVAARGTLMEEAAQAQPGSMTAVVGLAAEEVEVVASEVGCHVANYNTPQQTVLAGDEADVRRAAERIGERGGRAVPLSVAGAFHTPRMAEAEAQLAERIAAIGFSPPRTVYICGVSGQVEDDPVNIRALLCRQMTAPVRWTAVMDALGLLGVHEALEVGPGNVLTRLGRAQVDAIRFRTMGEVRGHG